MQLRLLLRPMPGIMALFLLGHFTHHICTAIHVPLLPLIRDDFALDYFQAGLLVSAFSLSYGLAQLPTGWLADRIGRRLLMSVGFAGIALWCFAVGLSQSFYQLAVFLVLVGLFGGTYHPSAPALLSESVSQKSWGTALGIHAIGGSASFFLTPVLAGLIASALGWRGAFLILAVPPFLAGILFWMLVKERGAAAREKTASDGSAFRELVEAFRHLGVLVGLAILSHALAVAVSSFIPLYLVDKHALQPAHASMMLSIYYVSGLVAAPLGGVLADRVGRTPVIVVSILATGPLIWLMTIAPFGPLWIAPFFLLGAAAYTRAPAVEALILAVPSKRRSSVLGIYYCLNLEANTVLAPVVGYLVDRLGFDPTFSVLATVALGTACLAVWYVWSRK